MRDKAFFDTNVVLYLYSTDEPEKRSTALRIVNDCRQGIISTQVVNELVNVLSKKMGLGWNEITDVLAEIKEAFVIKVVDFSIIQSACKISERYLYSYFDSLILASALSCDMAVLFSEDMQNEQVIEGRLKITNPFLR